MPPHLEDPTVLLEPTDFHPFWNGPTRTKFHMFRDDPTHANYVCLFDVVVRPDVERTWAAALLVRKVLRYFEHLVQERIIIRNLCTRITTAQEAQLARRAGFELLDAWPPGTDPSALPKLGDLNALRQSPPPLRWLVSYFRAGRNLGRRRRYQRKTMQAAP